MATSMLRSLSIPRPPASSHRAAVPFPPSAAISGRRRLLAEFKGLKSAARPRRAASSSSSAVATGDSARRGLVVCEAATDIPDVTKATWQTLVLESDIPVLVEFSAPWCGPCRMMHPVVCKLSKVYGSKLKCLKLNTDESPDIASQYGVRSIPTIMIFKNGEKKDSVIGAVPESTLVTCVEKLLFLLDILGSSGFPDPWISGITIVLRVASEKTKKKEEVEKCLKKLPTSKSREGGDGKLA